jgi:phosphoglycolate phosphatase
MSMQEPTQSSNAHPMPDWNAIDLVVFDVDGTLYDQKRLRLKMLRLLLADAWKTRSMDTLRTLRTFRHVREALGDEENPDFMQAQYARTAQAHAKNKAAIATLTSDWLERRPLPFLAGCRYPHVKELFAALRQAGKQVAVFSDYPARDKLAALGLEAHPVVTATDPEIGRLKPDPSGLLDILRRTQVPAARTLMIGDRFDRDAEAARRAGVPALIRSSQPRSEGPTFKNYNDDVFLPVLQGQLTPARP